MNLNTPKKLLFVVLVSLFLFLLISNSQAREIPNSDSLKEEALQGLPLEKVNLKGFGDPPPDPKGMVNLKGFGDPPPDPKGMVNLKGFGDPPPDPKVNLEINHPPPTPPKDKANLKIFHPPPTPPKANTNPPEGPSNR